jgi:uncharacterized protein YecE (DUF72 family)
MLAFYGKHLSAVEINNTFYRLPETSVLESWAEQVPDGFRFSIKASRKITHFTRLKAGSQKPTEYLLSPLGSLGDRMGVLLFQLPPNFKKDIERFTGLLAMLPEGTPVAWEFRHESWYVESVYGILRHHGAALVQHDYGRREVPEAATGPFGYLRLHGPDGHYRGSYDDAALERWAEIVREHAAHHRPVFVYFNNDLEGNAVRDARRLRSLLEAEGIISPKEKGDA